MRSASNARSRTNVRRREHEAFKALHVEALGRDRRRGLARIARVPRAAGRRAASRPPTARTRCWTATWSFSSTASDGFCTSGRPRARSGLGCSPSGAGAEGLCLVTGERAPIARLHPSIKGVRGAQSSGASIVSFNLDAFTSYGKEQGENAPVSEAAAFGYTTALNHLLRPGSRNRVQIGDASTVFWAESPAPAEEAWSGRCSSRRPMTKRMGKTERRDARFDAGEAAKIRDDPRPDGQGPAARGGGAGLRAGTRFFVLGLAPNAARLAIRFWHEDTLGDLAAASASTIGTSRSSRRPGAPPPAIWRLLYETAVQRKAENIPPHLAGEVMRAILTGSRYPRALLAAVIMRMRADGDRSTACARRSARPVSSAMPA